MKAQRRHELQRNALEIEILKLWEFLRRRGSLLAWVAVGVLAVVVAIWWYAKRSTADAESVQSKFVNCILLPPSEPRDHDLEEIAAKTSYPFWASMATIGLGDGVALALGDRWVDLGDAERVKYRQLAEGYYRKVISDFPKEELAVAKAHFGLGKLAESWGETDQARQEYEGILRDARTSQAVKGQPVLYLAMESLAKLPQFQGEVRMPASAPATSPSSGPASGPSSGPSTGPSSGPATRTATGPASSGPAASRSVVPATGAGAGSRPASTPSTRGAESD